MNPYRPWSLRENFTTLTVDATSGGGSSLEFFPVGLGRRRQDLRRLEAMAKLDGAGGRQRCPQISVYGYACHLGAVSVMIPDAPLWLAGVHVPRRTMPIALACF